MAASTELSIDIVVPVHDEAANVAPFYERIARLGLTAQLLFIDNASSDDTVERLVRLGVTRILRHERNLGYGASVRTAFAASTADAVIIIDADLEYPPEAIPEVRALLREHAVVFGSRFLGAWPRGMPMTRVVGNWLVSRAYNLAFRQRTTDFYTGLRAFRRDAIDCLALELDGFEHGVEIGAQLAAAGFQIHELPVAYTPRSAGRSKMRHLPEGLRFLRQIVAHWWRLVVLRRPWRTESHR